MKKVIPKEDKYMSNELYCMQIDLNVLHHLGFNLYSNIAAVLSEAVANAWDADASRINIDIPSDRSTITISDDGVGMTKDDINIKYLTVGYNRREGGNDRTPQGRPVMGRKGGRPLAATKSSIAFFWMWRIRLGSNGSRR